MEMMLQNRAQADDLYTSATDGVSDKPFGVSLTWLGLLFAVLASGSQSSNLPGKERELTSQVYGRNPSSARGQPQLLTLIVCCAYQALRMTTFVSHPQLEAIQTLLIICNVLAYNMNPGTAYVILGMTLRLGTALGLQADSPRFTPQETYARRRVWWALAWQDSHFSVSYDRPTSAAITRPGIPYQPGSQPGNRSYPESMFRIISLTLDIIRSRFIRPGATMSLASMVSYKEEVTKIVAEAAPHLRDRAYCRTAIQHQERCALKLHASYITSEICRPVLKMSQPGGIKDQTHSPRSSPADETIIAGLRQDYIRGLTRTITAFLEVHKISHLPARSWVGIQRAVSAAFLLAMLDEPRSDTKILGLLRSLEEVISQRMNQEVNHWQVDISSPIATLGPPGLRSRRNSASEISLEESPHWAKSMSQSLKALGKLNHALSDPRGQSGRPGQQALDAASFGSPHDPSLGLDMPQPTAASVMLNANKDTRGTPITPDSSSSSEWNYGNIAERAVQYVHAPLWG